MNKWGTSNVKYTFVNPFTYSIPNLSKADIVKSFGAVTMERRSNWKRKVQKMLSRLLTNEHCWVVDMSQCLKLSVTVEGSHRHSRRRRQQRWRYCKKDQFLLWTISIEKPFVYNEIEVSIRRTLVYSNVCLLFMRDPISLQSLHIFAPN